MKSVIILTFLIILIPFQSLFAQPKISWIKTYGGSEDEEGYSVKQTIDGGYIICGFTKSFGAGDENVYLIKTDASGDTVWTKTINDTGYNARGIGIEESDNGEYIITGYTIFPTTINALLIKTDSTGDTLWTKNYGSTNHHIFGWCIDHTSDGGYMIVGCKAKLSLPPDLSSHFWLAKTNAAGDTIWTRTYLNGYDAFGLSGQQTLDGGYILTGLYRPFEFKDHPRRMFSGLVKTNEFGDTIWTKVYADKDSSAEGWSVQQTDDGYIIYGDGYDRTWLIKTDANGDSIWSKGYLEYRHANGCYVGKTKDGGYFLSGNTREYAWTGYRKIYLIKTDSLGQTIWTILSGNIFENEREDSWGWTQQTNDGGYIVVGTTESPETNSKDILLMRVATDTATATEVSGIINSNTTWTINNSPYVITGNILVSENVTLTIQAGVEVKFNDYYIYIDGTLIAIGDSDNWIHFTSNQYCPQSGDWKEIKFRDKSEDAVIDEGGNYISGCIMRYCIVEYGSNASERKAIHIESCSPYLDNLVIQNNAYYGIAWFSSSPLITNCIIRNNGGDGNGVGLAGDPYSNYTTSNPVIQNCIVEKNNYGIWLNRGNSTVINCTVRNNKWEGFGLWFGNSTITSCAIDSNDYGLICRENAITTVQNCNIYDNHTYDVANWSINELDCRQNYWGTIVETEIESNIYDYYNDFDYGKVIYKPYLFEEALLSVNLNTFIVPHNIELHQNYPNPFNSSTKIEFALPKPETVKIEVYNIIGQKIETLLNKSLPAGYHEVEFNGRNLSSGVYLYRIEVGDPASRTGAWQNVKKMVLIR